MLVLWSFVYSLDYCCSKGGLIDKIVRDPNKTPDSSQRPSQNCARCGNQVDGPYCRGCALLRKKFKEDLFTYCVENGIFQDLQDTSESSNDNTNVVNAPQEPFVVKQDPGENSSQSPPHIDHNCCYECGDSLDDIFCQRCTCKSCGKGAHYGYNCPPQGGSIFAKKEKKSELAEDQAAKARYWKIPICYDDDDDEESSIPLKDIFISKTSSIEAINSNPPLSSGFVTKSPSTFPNSFLEETNTFDNSIPESETFCFNLEENSSGSTTTRSDYSLPDYKAFLSSDTIILKRRVVAVPLLMLIFLNMIRSSLICRSIRVGSFY
ncbi:hypothetical protein Tco_0241312 [Tanacetum coccineum]